MKKTTFTVASLCLFIGFLSGNYVQSSLAIQDFGHGDFSQIINRIEVLEHNQDVISRRQAIRQIVTCTSNKLTMQHNLVIQSLMKKYRGLKWEKSNRLEQDCLTLPTKDKLIQIPGKRPMQ